jgi:hypothetical protein
MKLGNILMLRWFFQGCFVASGFKGNTNVGIRGKIPFEKKKI